MTEQPTRRAWWEWVPRSVWVLIWMAIIFGAFMLYRAVHDAEYSNCAIPPHLFSWPSYCV